VKILSSSLQFSDYLNWLENNSTTGTFDQSYFTKHIRRFDETSRILDGLSGTKAIEIGATDYIPLKLQEVGYSEIWGTVFSSDPEKKRHITNIKAAGRSCSVQIASVNLEHDFFPVSDGYFDLVVFCEVLEHMDVDPMFPLTEFNRILGDGGKIVLTTPNSASARNFWAILNGYRPHFFTHYEKTRSPYRHNYEHDVHSVYRLLDSAGFAVEQLYTQDVFYDEHTEARQLIEKIGGEVHHRGDDIFCVARKVGPVKERWPAELYV
jgi:SAM-dependent methyltransferase